MKHTKIFANVNVGVSVCTSTYNLEDKYQYVDVCMSHACMYIRTYVCISMYAFCTKPFAFTAARTPSPRA